MQFDSIVQEAFEKAQFARSNAFAQLTDVKVGACIKVKGSDELYYGANVEYIVCGLSLCAERSAIANAISHHGKIEIEFVVVCSNTEPALYPCGVCLQTISEFANHKTPIYIGNKHRLLEKVTFKDLMPHQYSDLPKVLSE